MIGKLTGLVDSVSVSTAIIDVGGVGYEVTMGARQLGALPPVGEPVSLAIDTHMREDTSGSTALLPSMSAPGSGRCRPVQGVGAKVALAVLGSLTVADLANAVALQDKAHVARAQGVGPKVAARIVAELKDKMPALAPAISVPGGAPSPVAELPEGLAARDAVSALTNLGYAHGEAAAAVSTAIRMAGNEAGAAELIRLGLKELSQ
ncbi:Holliday junction branch migration protein RuvA [Methyloceanibacter stevinii]|uniref:Holliday junction branch migration protein RuvA n=1 Tax=Methyloceanibacter stevinii TaxID=1774970 RepID=UPI000A652B2D